MSKLIEDDASALFIDDVIDRISMNVSLLVDRRVDVASVSVSCDDERAVGASLVHVSFKLIFNGADGVESEGCLIFPLPEAITLACYLMMSPEEVVEAHRSDVSLDRSTKEAMVELGNFIGSSINESLRIHIPGASARANSCQGVRPDVRPAFKHSVGDQLLVARAKTRIHEFPEFEMIAMFPVAALAV